MHARALIFLKTCTHVRLKKHAPTCGEICKGCYFDEAVVKLLLPLSREERRYLLAPRDELIPARASVMSEREIVIDNLLVRIHLIIEMILVDRPCAM